MLPESTPTDPTPDPGAAPEADLAPEAADIEGVAHPRRIRSFVRRAGRTSTGQQRAIDEQGPRFLLPYTAEPLDWQAAFGREAPAILEIGFGMGETTAHIAALRPQDNFLGCEVHEPGVGALLKLLGERDIGNVRILQHDAVEVIAHMLDEASLDGVHIFFPDPWHKKRHNKRRLVQPPLVKLLASRLKPGGYIHCATDWEEYAHQMVEVLAGEPLLRNTSDAPGGFAPRPDYRPVTKFERRGLRLGHGVWDVVFRRQD
ncbi:tRNA (guanosine(46)-N7)-methyltransferase TrmB [Cupriavidus sp. USMAA2-4]|uniref:tRNA (guanine-N(7)-)-methyltransferase n=1 Tax=Cupriavidus malaysiensis TaxID=367825 RepID=A0A1D9I5D4_9BURK|nr:MULTISPECIES: tRNA (guanosine(46)-N7)-methyltransferase TrmB [Cupriavidus]AOY93044.1 tRNA (guanosine(46)-N7)-methyltransferase TrmB [Cupriavidus sp. USMAA2-4]AOZ00552.1 tRNA (guanosine(46)-N7)-methyltransferase TrmB [Cupriavidus sp. USMAHM13]AOZ07299.1 tRNA (guanosine(46)-N7)-methyltransferase TrmB [Cupriavidus malaysiensis]